MADFCKQCTATLLDADFFPNDLAGLSTLEDTIRGLYPVALCAGCGAIQVDHTGRCVSDCLLHHNLPEE